jgi:hypothetical protein
MRRNLITVLVALLIAVFAIGAPIPAKAAECSGSGCNVAGDAMTEGSCDLKGEPCKVAQNCAGQVLKMPAQAWFRVASAISKVAFAIPSSDDLSSASVTPEISPPRA